ncbi:MAG: hypothetical protein ACQEQH_06920 [Bacillota bacterium]
MPKYKNIFEQVIMLGLLPLLGGSRNIQTALIVAVVFILSSLLVRLVSNYINKDKIGDIFWVILIAFGISFSYLSYLITAYFYPVIFQTSGLYILLVGVTPITYFGCKEEVDFPQFWKRINVFFITIIFVGFIRELVGFGSILGKEIYEVGFAPVSAFGNTAGGFIILGAIWMLFRWLLSLGKINQELFTLEGVESNE